MVYVDCVNLKLSLFFFLESDLKKNIKKLFLKYKASFLERENRILYYFNKKLLKFPILNGEKK